MTDHSIFDELPDSTNDRHLTLPIHPTAFIFPSKLGNSLLFCVQGFTLLVNGGNETCPYWRLVRHLQRLDAVLVTNDGEQNCVGIQKLFKRKLAELQETEAQPEADTDD